MFCHELLLFLLENISSGIGTSRTVSSPSSRSKLGQSFLMRESLANKIGREKCLLFFFWNVMWVLLGSL